MHLPFPSKPAAMPADPRRPKAPTQRAEPSTPQALLNEAMDLLAQSRDKEEEADRLEDQAPQAIGRIRVLGELAASLLRRSDERMAQWREACEIRRLS